MIDVGFVIRLNLFLEGVIYLTPWKTLSLILNDKNALEVSGVQLNGER